MHRWKSYQNVVYCTIFSFSPFLKKKNIFDFFFTKKSVFLEDKSSQYNYMPAYKLLRNTCNKRKRRDQCRIGLCKLASALLKRIWPSVTINLRRSATHRRNTNHCCLIQRPGWAMPRAVKRICPALGWEVMGLQR